MEKYVAPSNFIKLKEFDICFFVEKALGSFGGRYEIHTLFVYHLKVRNGYTPEN